MFDLLRFYGELLWSALMACPALISSNWPAVVFSVAVATFAFWFDVREQFFALRTWRERGRAMREKKNIWNAVKALAYGCVLLFLCSLVKTIYEDHESLTKKNESLVAENMGLKQQLNAPKPTEPYVYRNNLTTPQLLGIIGQLHNLLSKQRPPLTFVFTSPKENSRFKDDFYAMVVMACQNLPPEAFCLIEPAPDPEVELNTGIPAAKNSGIVIHTDDGIPQLTGTMLRLYLDGCFIIRKSQYIPDGIKRLNPRPESKLVWFEIGPGSPWNKAGNCQRN
jgi:hypothetical protein